MKQSEFWIDLLVAVLARIIVGLIGAALGTWIWNLLMPYIFDLPLLSYWQFFGLEALIMILFPKSIKTSNK